jgi:hypothetical protein
LRAQPIIEIGALHPRNADELAAGVDRHAWRDHDTRPPRVCVDADFETGGGAVTDQITRKQLIPTGQIRELLTEVRCAEHLSDAVIDVFTGIKRRSRR